MSDKNIIGIGCWGTSALIGPMVMSVIWAPQSIIDSLTWVKTTKTCSMSMVKYYCNKGLNKFTDRHSLMIMPKKVDNDTMARTLASLINSVPQYWDHEIYLAGKLPYAAMKKVNSHLKHPVEIKLQPHKLTLFAIGMAKDLYDKEIDKIEKVWGKCKARPYIQEFLKNNPECPWIRKTDPGQVPATLPEELKLKTSV